MDLSITSRVDWNRKFKIHNVVSVSRVTALESSVWRAYALPSNNMHASPVIRLYDEAVPGYSQYSQVLIKRNERNFGSHWIWFVSSRICACIDREYFVFLRKPLRVSRRETGRRLKLFIYLNLKYLQSLQEESSKIFTKTLSGSFSGSVCKLQIWEDLIESVIKLVHQKLFELTTRHWKIHSSHQDPTIASHFLQLIYHRRRNLFETLITSSFTSITFFLPWTFFLPLQR